jgi:hypothetical protein
MKIKTVVFWILWVGNNLALQTVGGEDLELVSPPLFPDSPDDADLLCQTVASRVPQKEMVQFAPTLARWSA